MQSVVDRLFAGVTPQDFGGDVHFMCTADVAPPKQFEGQWSSIIPGSESQQPTWLGEHQLLKISAIVAIANVTDDRQQQAITAMGSYLHQHALIAPPVILIPVSDNSMVLAQKTVWPFVQHLLSQAIIDDLIWGMPIGFAFAFAVQAKMRSITAMLHQVQHDLCRRAARAESMYRMNDSIDFALWHYMGSRLLHNIPPVLEDVDEPNGHVAGFRIGGKLCKGVFGMVYKASRAAMPASDTQHHSMLVIDKQAERHTLLDLKMINRFLFVMETLQTVRHPNVSQLVSIFHLPKFLYVCMEVGGRRTLYSRLKSRDAPKDGTEPCALPAAGLEQIVVQICAAVIHIQEAHRVCHRDLKPENITISDGSTEGALNLKLSGFELALVQGEDSKCKSPCGTMPFAAPETFLAGSSGYDGLSADMWSLGILLLEVACGTRIVEQLITKKTGIDRLNIEALGSGIPPVPEFARNICSIFREQGVLTELLASAVPEAEPLMHWFSPVVRGLLVATPEDRLTAESLQAALPAAVLAC
mmetsp:Transcript_171665/g.550246  ORF Transcript_171665/g.550246 Transcript_171665/m.550246 type:complete len:528 (-) Transcript_171665:153-1736(-)